MPGLCPDPLRREADVRPWSSGEAWGREGARASQACGQLRALAKTALLTLPPLLPGTVDRRREGTHYRRETSEIYFILKKTRLSVFKRKHEKQLLSFRGILKSSLSVSFGVET